MADEKLPNSLQESILTALVFEEKWGSLIAAQVRPEDFDGPYQEIATRLLEYRREYGRAPGRAHLDDMFGKALQEGDRRAPRLRRILFGLSATEESLNAEYVAARTGEFVRRQKLKSAIFAASERFQQGGDGLVSDVEQILNEALAGSVSQLDAGLFLNDPVRGLSFMDLRTMAYPLGIDVFDHLGAGPAPKELLLYIAPKGTGKTWFCIHCGKQAIKHRKKMVHITLEVREELIAARYYQSLFAGSLRGEKFNRSELELDSLGRLTDFRVTRGVKPKLDFSTPGARSLLKSKMRPWGTRLGSVVVKEFPTSSLTIPQLTNYLDYLEKAHGFIPEMLAVDYPDLMEVKGEYRFGLRRIYEQLRGLAVKRNLAVIAPTQSNRESLKAKRTTGSQISEDKSKLDTSDTIFTYSQTPAERRMGLARLCLEYSRTTERDVTALITQSYQTGQYCLQSSRLNAEYWDRLKERAGPDDGGDDGDED